MPRLRVLMERICDVCDGSGKIGGEDGPRCHNCGGTGWVHRQVPMDDFVSLLLTRLELRVTQRMEGLT